MARFRYVPILTVGDFPTVPPKIYSEHHTDIENAIFKDYKKERRPVRKSKKEIFVNMTYSVNKVVIDEEHQTMAVSGMMQLSWFDEYLTWDPSKYGDISTIYVNGREIWRPLIYPENLVGRPYILPLLVTPIKSIGNVSQVISHISYEFKIRCYFDYSFYPYDSNTCPINFYFKNDWDIVFNVTKALFVAPTTTSNFHINSFEDYVKYQSRQHSSTIYFIRNATSFFVTFKLPSIICSILNILSFFISSKVSSCYLSMSNILLEFIFLHDMMTKLPLSIRGLPNCVIFYMILMISSFFTCFAHFSNLFGLWNDVEKKNNYIRPLIGIILIIFYIVSYNMFL